MSSLFENDFQKEASHSSVALSCDSSVGGGGSGSCNSSLVEACFVKKERASPICAVAGRLSLTKLCEERRARRCRFFRNGDQWYPGAVVAVGGDKQRTWEMLLQDLTRVLDHPQYLAAGVRHVFDLMGNKITSLENLREGGEYVASSMDIFKTIDYHKIQLPQWRVHAKRKEALHVQPAKNALPPTHSWTPGNFIGLINSNSPSGQEDTVRTFIKPKLITIIRNGIRPRKAIRLLLNRKTARSFEQVLNDITEAIKLDSGAVRKVFTMTGSQLMTLKEFFQHDDLFFAYGVERHYQDDFILDSEECKLIQPLIKGHVSPQPPRILRRMPSPQPPGRPMSPLAIFDGRGSLPRSPRKRRHRSPHKKASPSLEQNQNGHCDIQDDCCPFELRARYTVGRILGDGNFAIVKHCVNRITQEEFALKVIDKAKCKGKERMIESEVSILRRISHPNIVSLIEEFDSRDYLCLVMELMTGGDLFDAIASATKYTEMEASNMIRDLTAALHYLHEQNIVHRDIKPENLLVESRPEGICIKLGDFGLAVEVTEPLYSVCGTPTYVAPEILSETGYGLKVDIWAAGVIAYILLCGFPPFVSPTNNQEELFDQILHGYYEFHSPYWDHVSNLAKELIVNMIEVDQRKRFCTSQVLQHPWVAEVKNGGAENGHGSNGIECSTTFNNNH